MDFQPEINVMSYRDKYRPMYRLRPNERWCLIRRDKKPVECETASQARKIAQDLIDAIVSPVHVIEDEPEPLGSIDDWRRQKDAKAVAERERVFGSSAPSRLFRKGREIKVETKKRRAVA